MELKKEFLIKKFNEFNKKFFNNELPAITIRLSHSKRTFGSYRFQRRPGGEVPLAIVISNFYNQTGKGYCETLLHEMIHYYLSYKNIGRNEDCHGYHFQKMMREINEKSDYNITIRGCSDGLVSNDSKKKKEHTILIFKLRGIIYFTKVAGQLKKREFIEKNFTDVEFIKYATTTSSLAEKLIARSSRLSLIPATPENLKKYEIAA